METPNITCREVLLDKKIRWFIGYHLREDKLKLKKVKVAFFPYQIPLLLEQPDFLIMSHMIFLRLLQDCKNTVDPAHMKCLTSAE